MWHPGASARGPSLSTWLAWASLQHSSHPVVKLTQSLASKEKHSVMEALATVHLSLESYKASLVQHCDGLN